MELGEAGREGVEEVFGPSGELSGFDIVDLESVVGESENKS